MFFIAWLQNTYHKRWTLNIDLTKIYEIILGGWRKCVLYTCVYMLMHAYLLELEKRSSSIDRTGNVSMEHTLVLRAWTESRLPRFEL